MLDLQDAVAELLAIDADRFSEAVFRDELAGGGYCVLYPLRDPHTAADAFIRAAERELNAPIRQAKRKALELNRRAYKTAKQRQYDAQKKAAS